ncbi:hypothetical protein E8L99_18235 [Phreatobacter aquaticus]|uniref:DUF883 domain-containing protein n=1 Tax=Phreatobacter aquaticus TaxID=2570229 RepID=A0A4D7QPV2_9HYPH|nr:hypothetical protein [Phreatobacter aquaticus]QCK87559.1 hypothetical protein E8L99_18235 [Phreatobacter aquaticus]
MTAVQNESDKLIDAAADTAKAARAQLKNAGIDTDVMASRAGELGTMLKAEIAAKPFQAVGIALVVGFIYGLTR